MKRFRLQFFKKQLNPTTPSRSGFSRPGFLIVAISLASGLAGGYLLATIQDKDKPAKAMISTSKKCDTEIASVDLTTPAHNNLLQSKQHTLSEMDRADDELAPLQAIDALAAKLEQGITYNDLSKFFSDLGDGPISDDNAAKLLTLIADARYIGNEEDSALLSGALLEALESQSFSLSGTTLAQVDTFSNSQLADERSFVYQLLEKNMVADTRIFTQASVANLIESSVQRSYTETDPAVLESMLSFLSVSTNYPSDHLEIINQRAIELKEHASPDVRAKALSLAISTSSIDKGLDLIGTTLTTTHSPEEKRAALQSLTRYANLAHDPSTMQSVETIANDASESIALRRLALDTLENLSEPSDY